MARIKIAENKLKQIIRESVKKTIWKNRPVLNEGPIDKNKPVTLGELIKAIGYRGNVKDLINSAGTNKATPDRWAAAIEKQSESVGRNQSLGIVYKNLATQIRQSVEDRDAVVAGIKKATQDPNTYVQVGNRFSTGPGAQDVAPNAGKKYTFTQLAQSLGNKRDTTMSFQQVLHDSVGPWNGQDENTVRKTILSKISASKAAAMEENPENAQKAEEILNSWLQGGHPYRTNDVHWAMNVFDQVIKTSRNDMPTVAGFQRTLNSFGIKDAKGKPYSVDGIIGNATSNALKQNGFANIFDFKNAVIGAQKALGIKPDGIVGKNTLAAFKSAGIDSFGALKTYAERKAAKENPNQEKIVAGNYPEIRADKITLSENELKQIIRESVENVLNEMNEDGFGDAWGHLKNAWNSAGNAWNALPDPAKGAIKGGAAYGPIGAAIGAGVGALQPVVRNATQIANAKREYKRALSNYQTTGDRRWLAIAKKYEPIVQAETQRTNDKKLYRANKRADNTVNRTGYQQPVNNMNGGQRAGQQPNVVPGSVMNGGLN